MGKILRRKNADNISPLPVLIMLSLALLITLICSHIGLSADGADLVVSNLNISPRNPSPGDRVEVSVEVLNQGADDTDRFYVRLYVNGDRVDHKPIAFGLDAGETDTVTFSWSVQPGENQLKAVVDDPFDKVAETNEDNNSLTQTVVNAQPAAGSSARDLTVAVVSFEDRSNTGFANVSHGLADMIIEKLVNSGFHVLERQEIERVLFEQRLNPSNNSDLAMASSPIGADAIIAGSVTGIDIRKSRISLGFLTVTGATVGVNMTYRVISAYTGEILSGGSATGKAEGQTSASFNVGAMINSISQVSTSVCTGGFRADKNVYAPGEIVTVGYLDPTPPSTFTVQFFDSGGFSITPPLLFQSTSPSNNCATWNWNPSPSLTSGSYSVKLLDSSWNVVASKNFSVSSGTSPSAWVNQVTFGTKEFADSIVGEAVEKTLATVAAELTGVLNDSSSILLEQRGKSPSTGGENGKGKPKGLRCQVINLAGENTVILGGIAGNCGKKEGVKVDEVFSLYAAKTVSDPDTGELIEVIPKTEDPKGKIVIIDVYDKACRAQLLGSFEAEEGDLAISV